MNTSKFWYLWANTRTITTQVNITSLVFEFEGRTIAGEAVDLSGRPLNRGDVWRGPLPGIPYVLAAGSKDIYYRYAPRPGVTKEVKLSRVIGVEQAQQIAREIGEVKGHQGGRFYVNEYCNAFCS